MSNPDSYIREIDSIDQELKRTNARLKILRNQKREKQTLLYKYMIKNKLDTYRGKSLSSVRPREHHKRKTEAQKKQESIILFREAGIDNPEEFYREYKEKLKSKEPSDDYTHIPKKKKENDYDPILGF